MESVNTVRYDRCLKITLSQSFVGLEAFYKVLMVGTLFICLIVQLFYSKSQTTQPGVCGCKHVFMYHL